MGKQVIILLDDQPIAGELMYLFADAIVSDIPALLAKLITADDIGACIAAIGRA
jgi:hypothetical protein